MMWGETTARVKAGLVSRRREKVLKVINLKEFQHWGTRMSNFHA